MSTKQRKKIKKLLIDRDITVTELADKIGRCPACVSQIISGKRNNPTTQAAIADALKMPAQRLFGRREVA